MEKIIQAFISILFLGFGKYLKGYKTIIVNVLLGLIAAAEFASDKVHLLFCDTFKVGCESTFWATLATITILLNAALRTVTDTALTKSE